MTKILRAMIEAENTRRGKQVGEVGYISVVDEVSQVAETKARGHQLLLCGANAREFGEYLAQLDRRELRCTACRRDEAACSADPCGAVRVDRERAGVMPRNTRKPAYLKKDRQERYNSRRGWFVNAWRIVDAAGVDLVQPWCNTKTQARELARNLGYMLDETGTR